MAIDELQRRSQWECRGCGYQFSVTSGTIMHDTHLPLRKWFVAIYLMCDSRKGVSANQLKRQLKVAYKTAWYLCHRIREAMGNDPLCGPTLVGVIEVDETMVGGKRRGEDWRENKHWVAGAIQKGRQRPPGAHPRRKAGHSPRIHPEGRQGRGRGDLHRRPPVLHRYRRPRHAPRDRQPLRRGVGHRGRPHKQHRRRVEPLSSAPSSAPSTK